MGEGLQEEFVIPQLDPRCGCRAVGVPHAGDGSRAHATAPQRLVAGESARKPAEFGIP